MTEEKKFVLFAKKPNPFQNEYYCVFCGSILNYLWLETNGIEHLMGIGCDLTLYCNKCETIFQPDTYFNLTRTELKDYPAEIIKERVIE